MHILVLLLTFGCDPQGEGEQPQAMRPAPPRAGAVGRQLHADRGTYVRPLFPRGRTATGLPLPEQDGMGDLSGDGDGEPAHDEPTNDADKEINFSCPPSVRKLAAKLTAKRGGAHARGQSSFEATRKWKHEIQLPLNRPIADLEDFYQHTLILWDPITVYRELFPADRMPCPKCVAAAPPRPVRDRS